MGEEPQPGAQCQRPRGRRRKGSSLLYQRSAACDAHAGRDRLLV